MQGRGAGGDSNKNEGPNFIRQSKNGTNCNSEKDDVVSIISIAKSLLVDGKLNASVV